LKKEESIHAKWTPWVLPYLLVMMAFITWITTAYTSMVAMAGIVLIACGAYVMFSLFHLHLLIFGVASLVGKGGLVGTFYGIMLGLTGGVTGSMYAVHAKKYEILFHPKYEVSFTGFKMQ